MAKMVKVEVEIVGHYGIGKKKRIFKYFCEIVEVDNLSPCMQEFFEKDAVLKEFMKTHPKLRNSYVQRGRRLTN